MYYDRHLRGGVTKKMRFGTMSKTGEFNFFLQFKFGNCGLFPQFSTTLLKRLKKGEMSLIFTDKKGRPHKLTPDHLL